MKSKLILLIIILVAFRGWLTLQPICYGDCLHFYPQNLLSFFNAPFVWDNRGGNSGLGGYTPMFLYMYLPSLILGFLYKFFRINYEISQKIVWFFPFIIFSVISIHKLTKVFKLSYLTFWFASVFYLLNTYVLLVIGGGQVGVALAYSLFPLSFAFMIEALSANRKGKLLSGLALSVLGIFDIRIALFVIAAFIIYVILYFIFDSQTRRKKAKNILTTILSNILILLGIHFYWILPTIIGGGVPMIGSSWGSVEQLESLSWMNINHVLFIFQPHWYQNVFGKLQPTQFEFFLIPILVFLPLIFKKISYQIFSLLEMAIIFAFFAKGINNPLPEIFRWLFINVPGFNLFRDPTKFLIPQITVYSILIGMSINALYEKLASHKQIAKGFLILSLLYLLILVRQIFIPGLSGTFRGNSIGLDYLNIKNQLEKDNTFYRTLWYPGKEQFSYSDFNHPRLNASNDFSNIRPLNIFIEGTYDSYSYLKYPFTQQIFDILGIRYIFLTDLLNKPIINKSDIEDKVRLEKHLNDASWLSKLNEDDISVYENLKYSPQVFAQNKTFWVIGSDDLYRIYSIFPDFKLRNQGFVFLDEGNNQNQISKMLQGKDTLFFNNKNDSDLAFLLVDKKYFYSPANFIDQKNGTGGWGKSDSSQIVGWRNILENRGFRNTDFDLGKGFTWTDSPASMEFPLQIEKNNDYELFIRYFANSKGSSIDLTVDNNFYEVQSKELDNNFIWERVSELSLAKGSHQIKIESKTGLNIINVVAFLPKGEFSDRLVEAKQIINKFKVNDKLIANNSDTPLPKVEYEYINPTKYKVKITNAIKPFMLIFSENFHPLWQLNLNGRSYKSIPIYSTINGFNIDQTGELEGEITFSLQNYIAPGLWVSIIFLLIILILLVL